MRPQISDHSRFDLTNRGSAEARSSFRQECAGRCADPIAVACDAAAVSSSVNDRRAVRRAVLILLAVGFLVAGPAASADEPVTASRISLPCIPVATYWTGPPQPSGMPQGPDLAVVSTDIRPKDAQIHLNGRFIGRARYFDGSPDYLYLEPGRYEMEIKLGGYRTEVVDIEAKAGCRFSLKHRLQREKGSPKEHKNDPPGKGKPLERVFAPDHEEAVSAPDAASAGGPDPSLRKDLRAAEEMTAPRTKAAGASLRVTVNPPEASLYLDGAFVATGRELEMMEGPLATTSGAHRIEVRAPGFVAETREIELQSGEVFELEVTLTVGVKTD